MGKGFGRQVVNCVAKIPQNRQFSPAGELLNLQKSCINGAFYDDLLIRYEGDKLTRDELKDMMFAVLFSKNEVYKDYIRTVPYQKDKEQFAKVYPYTSKVIEILKQKDHTKLAILLQRIESTVFIDTICPCLVDEGIIPLTVHDSIIVEAGKAKRALEVCQNVFKEGFGVIPTFHVEPLKKDDYEEDGSNSGSETSLPKAVEEGQSGKGNCVSKKLESKEPRQGQCIQQEMAGIQSRQSA
jgi:hypothetical protein